MAGVSGDSGGATGVGEQSDHRRRKRFRRIADEEMLPRNRFQPRRADSRRN